MVNAKNGILQVVRRFGPVGGMERYVWELAKELVALGHPVEVLCERCYVEPPLGVNVISLGEIAPRPRWLSYLRFGHRVAQWLERHPHPGWLIHSHERLGVHDVTTFHGPPFASVRERPWWKKISLRIRMQLFLERRELRVARAIIPNSEFIRRQLADYYPEYASKLTLPVVPGVLPGIVRELRSVVPDGGVVGFVGREWKRKGLAKAVAIVAVLRRQRPALEFWVAGPSPEEIQHLFTHWDGGYRLLGWRTDNDYLRDFDVLLHPASAEPYGMVISEAMAARVPVVVSDVCGAAAQVGTGAGAVLGLSEPNDAWVTALDAQLSLRVPVPRFTRGWDEVARECERVYLSITPIG
ncbi:MAG: glycosyltransferase family 4 protein [Gallionella sp.]|nr:glycosyltransferase family 4 protein [Gallionella sp.]